MFLGLTQLNAHNNNLMKIINVFKLGFGDVLRIIEMSYNLLIMFLQKSFYSFYFYKDL